MSLLTGVHGIVLAAGSATTQTKSGSSLFTPLLLVGLFALFYFFIIRPRSQRQRQQRDDLKKAGLGDEIATIGGLVGTIVAEDGDRITVSTGSGTELVFLRQAIGRKITPPAPEPTDPVGDPDEPGPVNP